MPINGKEHEGVVVPPTVDVRPEGEHVAHVVYWANARELDRERIGEVQLTNDVPGLELEQTGPLGAIW